MISRNQILTKVNTYDILVHFLRPYSGKRSLKSGQHISNPFLDKKQKTPSFNIYQSKKTGRSKEWRYRDFTGMDGSAFDLVMNLFRVSFPESCEIINKEMCLGLTSEYNKEYKPKYIPKPESVEVDTRKYDYSVEYLEWNDNLLRFWQQYGTKQDTLELFHVKPIKRACAFNRNNKPYIIESTKESPIYAYINDNWLKWYQPYSKRMKFGYMGKKPDSFVFGLKQLPEKGQKLYLVGGEKDVITLRTHKFYAITLNSEESALINYPEVIDLINSDRFKEKYVMYDNDQTGIKRAKEICSEYPVFLNKVVPSMDNGTDISDWYKEMYSKRAQH
jgi:hypothetical protein